MSKEFKRKISSRKFQAAILAVLMPVLMLLKVPNPTKEHIMALAIAVLGLISYIYGEAYVDAKRVEAGDGDITIINTNKNDLLGSLESTKTLENHGGGGYTPKIEKERE